MSRFFSLLAAASSLLAFAAPATADEDGILPALRDYDCRAGAIPQPVLYLRALEHYHVLPPSPVAGESQADSDQRIAQFASSIVGRIDPEDDQSLGARARLEQQRAAMGERVPHPLAGEDRDRADLYLALADFVTGREQTNKLHVQTRPMPADRTRIGAEIRQRIYDFLAQAPEMTQQITIGCSVAHPHDDTPVSRTAGYLEQTRIAQTLDGARGAAASRNYATASGRWDEASHTNTFSFEGVALFGSVLPAQGGDADLSLRPYIGYQRTQSDDASKNVDNLSFGWDASFSFDGNPTLGLLPTANLVAASLEWQTDDRFRSSMTHGEIDYYPTWGGRLGDDRRIDCFGGLCDLSIAGVLDYVEVSDATGKPKLASLHQYARFGGNFLAGYYFGPPDGWVISLTGDYRVRASLNDEGGAANLFHGRLAFAPAQGGSWSFGLDYVSGDDLTSLADQEYWALSLGFRR